MLLAVKYLLDVADMDRAVAFYAKTFGLDVVVQTEEWSELRFGSATVALHGGRSNASLTRTGLSFAVSDLDAAVCAVDQNGGRVLTPPFAPGGEGVRLAEFVDPENNHFMASQDL